MEIVLNEKTYAEKCLESKTLGEKPFYSLNVLAKYYYKYFGYRKMKIIKMLTEFIDSYYPQYHSAKAMWDNNIENIAKRAGKIPLYEIDGVWVTDAELAKIDDLPDKVLRRLAFTLLCLAKLNHERNIANHGWVNQSDVQVFELARISGNRIERSLKYNKLYTLGYIEYPKANDNLSIRVTYMDENADSGLFISDFRELGYEYMKLKGVNIIRCAECGILTRGNKYGNKKYCKKCAGYTPREHKIIVCIDCGKEILISSLNNKTKRCADCQSKIDKEKARIRKQKQRDKDSVSR